MQDNYFIGAFIRKKLVGYAAMILKKEELNNGEIKRFFVDENYRGQKIAMKLMQALEHHALNQNYKWIRLKLESISSLPKTYMKNSDIRRQNHSEIM